ncbi:WD repeat-containing protein on Y chromosome [Anopheles maculipalpis]|uniref:WD repeat-containing protein on Y chromosome n=1 Tax=Anopheles maculipalpis TaxID=1496333 RepID=UPI002158C225|nr:WD repeat-containing protein on Y chromosome [Anopheles maculipalpis]
MAGRLSSAKSEQEIHRFVTREQIDYLHGYFRLHSDRLTRLELRELLSGIGLQYTGEEYRTLWLQINTDHDDFCQWDEFLSYLILGFQDDDPLAVKQSLDPPISGDLCLKLRRQVYNIIKIDFCPMVYYDGSISWSQGHWITTSREGAIQFWTEDWKPAMTARSAPSNLKRSKTWLLATVPLPDMSMFCVAGLETELRFYDVVASSFTLKLVIERLPHPISAMAYRFNQCEPAKLITGDYDGHIRLFVFYPERKATSASETYSTVTRVTLLDVLHGKYPPLECTDYGMLLSDMVRSAQFVDSLGSFIVCAEENPLASSRGRASRSEQSPSMVIHPLELPSTSVTKFYVPRGVTCFAFEPTNELLVSGGPDCDLRLWDIHRPDKPSVVLVGHTSSITFVFLQDGANKIYSLDQKKIIKVWDVRNRVLLQTFSQFSTVLVKGVPACAYYNARERELVVASNKLFVTACCPEIALDRTDGDSHTKPVSVLLYNELYQLVVSCGFDSFIIVWDHRVNRKMTIITEAHTQVRNGVLEPVEITAGCFDGKQQLLLTGARNGSLKIWNLSGRTCMRAIQMDEDCEVTAVFWQENRILAMGWNHRVVEYAAFSENDEYPRGLQWRKLHSHDILCAAVSGTTPGVMATSSYAGELVLWMLETGQPYRRYDATNPRSRIPILFREGPESKPRKLTPRRSMFLATSGNVRQRRLSRIVMPSGLEQMRRLSIQSLLFLASRPMVAEYGTLLGSLDDGTVQVWSHHVNGGFKGQFNGIHMAGDRVITMATDKANRFLFTGTALGYVKTWYIENCWIPDEDKFHVNKPALRIMFPFLLNDVVPGRAKRSARAQPKPWLLNSYQAHRTCVTGLVYLDATGLLLSCSSDRTVRLWSLGGCYIGLLGSPVSWEPLETDLPLPEGYRFRIPPDLQREVSFTTAKVLRGGKDFPRIRTKSGGGGGSGGLAGSVIVSADHQKQTPLIDTYGSALVEPILNTTVLKLPSKEPQLRTIKLEQTYPSLPLYGHMVQFPIKSLPNTTDVEMLLERTKALQFKEEPYDHDAMD